jgi:hypothetical protein
MTTYRPTTRKPARGARFGVAGAITALTAGAAFALPAAASQRSSAWVTNDVLKITGTRKADDLVLRLAAGAPGTLEVDFADAPGAEFSFDRTTFSRIEVHLGNGADRYTVDQVNGSFADEAIKVWGENGNDSFAGGDNAEQFFGGRGNDSADGNRGSDTANLGSGHDSFRWDPGDGSDIVDGGSGVDTLDFNGANGDEQMSLFAEGRRAIFFRVQGTIRIDMDNVEHVDLDALGGVDTFDVGDVSRTDVRLVDADLSGPSGGGDGQADVVTVNGTQRADVIRVAAVGGRVDVRRLATKVRISGPDTIDRLQVMALDGNDRVHVDAAAQALMTVAVDLGSGQH